MFTSASVAPLTLMAPMARPLWSVGRVSLTSLTTSPVAVRSPALMRTGAPSLAPPTSELKRPGSSPGMVTTTLSSRRSTREPGMSRTIWPSRRPAESPAAFTTRASRAASSTKRRVFWALATGALGAPLGATVLFIPATTATALAARSARLWVFTTPSVAAMVVVPCASICTAKAVPCTVLTALAVCTS